MLGVQPAWAQFTVSGVITDGSTGEPLIGANVFHQPSSRGATTNVNGEFTLELPGEEATLRVSFVGYASKNITVSASDTKVTIELTPDIANLDELVVTGLASSVKRENLANAVTKVGADELTGTVASPTVDNALSGKIPGVNIRSNSGAPGGGFNVQMRGISTLGAGTSQPLYIIDGVYVNNSTISNGRYQATGATSAGEDNGGNRLADLNPDDIESIEVLKGPSAAAIYGQRANAGVVIITTKRGSAGATEVGIEQNIGFSSPLNLLGVASWSEEKINSLYSGEAAEIELERFRQAQSNGNIYDYEDIIYGNRGLISETNVSVSGGDEVTQFFVSAGLHAEEGIIDNTGFDRGSIRANLDHDISDNIRISSSSNFSKTANDRGFTGNQNGSGGSLGYTLAYTPTYAQLFPDEEGNYPANQYFDDNPLAIIEHAKNEEDITRFIQSLDLNTDLYQEGGSGLSLNIKGGIDYLNYNSLIYFPEFLQNQQASSNPGDVIRTKEDNLSTNLQAVLLFNQALSDFDLTTQVGFSRYEQQQSRQQLRGQGLVTGQDNINQAQVQSVLGQNKQQTIEIGWFGQQEVNWDDKLIGTVGLRLDRSSLNYNQSEYYLFPKASLAANIANFNFFELDNINQFKLRAAYGVTGGVPSFGDTFRALNGSNIGSSLGLTISTRDIDPNLKPERAQELEFGTDIGLLQNRLSFSATYYIKTVEDLILDLPTASSTGVTAIATNAAELENKGIELGLNASPIQQDLFSWNTDLLFWKNNSKITRLNIPPDVSGGFGVSLGNYLLQEGFSPTAIVGIPETPEEKALYTMYGNAQPDFQASLGNQLSFLNGFQFNFLFHWSQGNYNVNLFQFLTDDGGTSTDWNTDSDGDGTPKGIERLSQLPPESYVQEASYIKLREVGLHYNVPTAFIENTFSNTLQSLQFGISASNVWMWTTYDGYDPEVSTFGTQTINQSVSVAPYPSSRKVLFNIKLDF
ncbi:SusC/RagA family TonB-linked outer membrane protein [Aliifodinibius sp. 1BSP15-2V2]|uniref:SusC/RagA family TonB-linked outer membrane protein n=2 Tax=Fodinibius salsisoli TaxID=2820877 RepID=A0ABT3PP66_9BACT|nr:SusC/RagA family TonB-linked outer membrane protein [Fodinibius salsisoli]